MSQFTHSGVVQTCMTCYLLQKTKEDTLTNVSAVLVL